MSNDNLYTRVLPMTRSNQKNTHSRINSKTVLTRSLARQRERASERFMWFHIRQSTKICRIEYILLLDSLSPIGCVFNCKRENQIKMNLIDFNWNVRDFRLFLAVHNPHFKFGWDFSNICFSFFSEGETRILSLIALGGAIKLNSHSKPSKCEQQIYQNFNDKHIFLKWHIESTYLTIDRTALSNKHKHYHRAMAIYTQNLEPLNT